LKRLARNQRLPYKRFQIGRVFRDEPVSSTRFREFEQCDVDVVGASAKDEVEVMSLASKVLKELGIKNVIYFNNRKLLNEILVSEGVEERDREQVIRELDKLDKLSRKEVADNLKKLRAERILKVVEGDLSKYNFYKEIKATKKLAKAYGLKVEFLPTLARGLSYYNGTVFEIKTKDMSESICGGGAYMVDEVQAFGFAFGLDRLAMLSSVKGKGVDVQIISIEEDLAAVKLAGELRDVDVSVNLILDKSVGKALEYADSKRVGKVVFVGADEVKKGKFKVKDMGSGVENFLAEEKIVQSLRGNRD